MFVCTQMKIDRKKQKKTNSPRYTLSTRISITFLKACKTVKATVENWAEHQV